MQENHLMDFKLKCFTIDLHEVIFKKRTQEGLTDGCAMFFNYDVFELMDVQKVEYNQPNIYVSNSQHTLEHFVIFRIFRCSTDRMWVS